METELAMAGSSTGCTSRLVAASMKFHVLETVVAVLSSWQRIRCKTSGTDQVRSFC